MLKREIIRRVLVISQRVFLPLALACLFYFGYKSRGIFMLAIESAHLTSMLVAISLCVLLHPLTAAFSWTILRGNETRIPYNTVLAIQMRRLPARYLPGGIWQTVSRMVDLHHCGVGKRQLSVLAVLENLVPLALAIAMGGFFICASGDVQLFSLAAVFIGISLAALIPMGVRHRLLLNSGWISLSRYWTAIMVMVVFWAIAATAFTIYWFAFPVTGTAHSALSVAGSYLLSWSAGFLAIFAPQGIGVFESVAGIFLHGQMPLGSIATLIAGYRVIVFCADISAYGIYLLLRSKLSAGSGTIKSENT